MSTSITVERGAELLDKVRAAVAGYVVGQDATIADALTGFLARGHVLVEGVPGTAKTLLVRALAGALGLRFARIQFTPDLMPSDVTGVMAERQVTVDGVSRPLGAAFTVYATQNPVEHEGTYPLPEAQLDRFLLKTVMPYPTREAELELLARYEAGFDAERIAAVPVAAALSADEATQLRSLVDGVRVAEEVRTYIADITRSTREERMLSLGASPRATVALFRASRAAAVLDGRDFVTPDDVKGVAPAVLRHRITLAPELEVEGRTTDDVLAALLTRVRVPE
jgi:MoxR-like ATPase